jgi:hypothetical protein
MGRNFSGSFLLLHNLVAVSCADDAFDYLVNVPRLDHEPGGMQPDITIFVRAQRHGGVTPVEAALAEPFKDHRRRTALERRDPLVGLSKQALIARGALLPIPNCLQPRTSILVGRKWSDEEKLRLACHYSSGRFSRSLRQTLQSLFTGRIREPTSLHRPCSAPRFSRVGAD